MTISLRSPFLLSLFVLLSSGALAQECGSAAINEAEGLYNIGKFYESISRLNACITNKGFTGSGERLDSGTVSPQVHRETKEIGP